MTRFVLLLAIFFAMGCDEDEPSKDATDIGIQSDTGTMVDSETDQDEGEFDLGSCLSLGGGSLNETQCNRGWDCDDKYEVLCQGEEGNPEACRCFKNDTEVAEFQAETPGEICGQFSTGTFAQTVTEGCGFP